MLRQDLMSQADEHKLRRILLGTPPWLIERYNTVDGRIELAGWALTPDGDVENWHFLVNGRQPDSARYPLATPSLERVFPFCAESGRGGFVLNFAVTDSDIAIGHVEIAFVNRYTQLPASDYLNQFIDLKHDLDIVVPDGDQLFRTQGNRSADRYKLHGFTTFKRIERAIYRHSGRRIDDFKSILDWGCGCGRLTQQFALRLPGAAIQGIDIDAPNVEWCRDNIPKATFSLVAPNPPTHLPPQSIDLLVGISVMTHLDYDAQCLWLGELRRIVMPAGYLVLTTHGEMALARVKNFEVIRNTLTVGMDASTTDKSLDAVISSKEYYKSSYHLRKYVYQLFGEYFDVIDIIAGGNASLQDFVILRRRQ